VNRRLEFEEFVKEHRTVFEPLLDCVIWAVSLLAVSALSVDLNEHQFLTLGVCKVIGIALASQITIGWVAPLYRVRWKNASFEETVALAATVTNATAIDLIVNILVFRHAMPTRSLLAAGAYAFLGCAGIRGVWRLIWEFRTQKTPRAKRAIVFGAGVGGEQVIDALWPRGPFLPVALLDDSPQKRNAQLRHLRVSGTRADIATVAKAVNADTLVVAIPSASSGLIRVLSDQATRAGLDIRVLPQTSELLQQPSVRVSDVRTVTERDLLGRHVIETDVEAIAGYITGRRVLVTGAGGSIGSELCRQIHRFTPAKLVMLDRDESGLHELQLSMEGRALLDKRTLVVCNIQDVDALDDVFREHRPEVVFHAAALKHLPLLEMWPAEAIKTNVIGTRNLLAASMKFGVGRLVNISTDKAADPVSVLGYTKRIAERLTSATTAPAGAVYMSVRFGNVLGSRGSVLITFRAQILAGGPVTVTDPDVTRYFMTVQEAVQLVIQAGAIGGSGEVLVLDMGSPARIAEVARRLVEESNRPIEILFTGLRPGEKLHEVLFEEGEPDIRPQHQLISHVQVPPIDTALIGRLDLSAPPETLKDQLALVSRSPAPTGISAPVAVSDTPEARARLTSA
jgi:FlaA1/EpsC-like NDP-sugar epimerase